MVDSWNWKPEAHWPSDVDLIGRVVRKSITRYEPRWVRVMEELAVGSTVAHALYRRFGYDPDERLDPALPLDCTLGSPAQALTHPNAARACTRPGPIPSPPRTM
jgi:hypothetical protein